MKLKYKKGQKLSEFQKKLLQLALVKLSPKHRAKLDKLNHEDKSILYLSSFIGEPWTSYNGLPKLYYPSVTHYDNSPIKKRLERLRRNDIDHTPWSSKRFVGVELELCLPKKAHEKLKNYKMIGLTVKDDGSIRTNLELFPDGRQSEEPDTSAEVAVLLVQGNYEPLKQLLNFLNSNGAYVNRSCGLHVHLDQRHNDKKEALKVFNRLQNSVIPLLSKMVDMTRIKENRYCRLDRNPRTKYQAINFLPYKNRKTIEVRLHHGSLDFDEITTWIDTLIAISETKGLVKPKKQKSMEETIKLLKLPAERSTHLTEKAKAMMEEEYFAEAVSE